MALQLSDIQISNNKLSLIRDYLEDTSSSAEFKAKELTTAAHDSSLTTDKEGECSLEGFLCGLWSEVVGMIKHTPHNHPWQDKVVKLLSAIKEVPRKVTLEMEELERGGEMDFWQDLPMFGAEMGKSWNNGAVEDISDEMLSMLSAITFFPLDVWANLTALAARLTAASALNLETYAICMGSTTYA